VPLRGTIFQDRDYGDKILVEGEDIEMFKKHEQEKMAAMKEDEIQIEDEMEAVRCSSVSTFLFSSLKYCFFDVLPAASCALLCSQKELLFDNKVLAE